MESLNNNQINDACIGLGRKIDFRFNKIRINKLKTKGISIGDKCIHIDRNNFEKVVKVNKIIERIKNISPSFEIYKVKVQDKKNIISECFVLYFGVFGKVCVNDIEDKQSDVIKSWIK